MSVLFETTCGDSGLALSAEWTLVAGTISVDTGYGYGGTNGIISTTAPYTTPWLCKTISPSPAGTITMRWWQWIPAMPLTGFATYVVAGVYYNNGGAFDFANRQVSINTTDDGKFLFKRGSFDGTTIAGPTTDPVWVANTWNEIEVTIVVHNTTGSITLKKAGVTVLTATGLDTQALGTEAIDGVEIIPQSASGSHAAIDTVRLSDPSTPPAIVGSAVFGVTTTVKATRAIAFGLDNNVNVHNTAGMFKVFGNVSITGDLTVDGTTTTTHSRLRAATTTTITIATALNNADTLDGVTIATGDRVLVKNQTAPAENGIYVVGASPARSSDFDAFNDHPGSLITVSEGTTNADTLWLCTSNAGGTLGTTAIAFTQVSSGLSAPTGAPYVTLATDATLTAERVLTAGTGISLTDAGAGGTVTINAVPGSGGSGNVTNTGAAGSEPGSPATGDLYLPNNGFYVQRYSGSVWSPWGPIFPMTPPVSGDFAWDNQGSSTLDTTNGGIYISSPAASGNALHLRVKTAPSTPYTITMAFLPFMSNTNTMALGMCFRQSSDGKIVNLYQNHLQASGVEKWTTSTSFSAAYADLGNIQPLRHGLSWMRITDNGTNRICALSQDGQHWYDVHTVGRTDFLTADQVGFFVCGINATTTLFCSMTVLSWKQT